VKPDDCGKAMLDDIAAVQKDGITTQELEKAQIQLLRTLMQFRQSDLYEAITICNYAVYFDDPDLINTIMDKYDAVTADQVKTAAQKYLVAKELAVVTDLPAPPASKAEHATKEGR